MCSSHCSNQISRKAAIDAFNHSYLCPRYLTIIYNCLIIYFTLNIHATTHDNSIISFVTPFHQSALNSRSDRWRDWLPNQHHASIRIYFQGVYCDINTLVLYHLSYVSLAKKGNMSVFGLDEISCIYIPTTGIWLLSTCSAIPATRVYVCMLWISTGYSWGWQLRGWECWERFLGGPMPIVY